MDISTVQLILKYHLISRYRIVNSKLKVYGEYDKTIDRQIEERKLLNELIEIQEQLRIINSNGTLTI